MTDQITGVRGPQVSVRGYMSLCTVYLLIHITHPFCSFKGLPGPPGPQVICL